MANKPVFSKITKKNIKYCHKHHLHLLNFQNTNNSKSKMTLPVFSVGICWYCSGKSYSLGTTLPSMVLTQDVLHPSQVR